MDPGALRTEMRTGLSTITGKLEILWLLYQRVHRFGELRRANPGSAAVTHSWRYSEGVLDGEVCGWCGMLPAVERIRLVSKIF
jgi:hypothetical protein